MRATTIARIATILAALPAIFTTLAALFTTLFATLLAALPAIVTTIALPSIRHHRRRRRCDQRGDENPFPSHSHEASTDEGQH